MKEDPRLAIVRALAFEDDVELVDIGPAEVRHDGRRLRASTLIRVGARYLVETVEYPGEWWIGELHGGRLLLFGCYGTLEEAASAH